jgi:hypothetical protein
MIQNTNLNEFINSLFVDLNSYQDLNLKYIYFYINFDGCCSFEPLFMKSDMQILNQYALLKEYKLKLSKKDSLADKFQKPFQNYLFNNLFHKNQEIKKNHPKHLKIRYNIKTKQIFYEESFVELRNYFSFRKGTGEEIFDEWVEELKTGIKNPDNLFDKKPGEEIYKLDEVKDKYIKIDRQTIEIKHKPKPKML